MILKKWNYEKQDYEDYEVPDEYNCRITTGAMDEVVNCPHCGKKILFGNTYTSKEIKSKYGFKYAICSNCHKNEIVKIWNYGNFNLM